MQSDELTAKQYATLKAQVGWMLRYLSRLRKRMIKRKFLESDPLLQRVREAHSAVHSLSVELHYLSCESGVGRPERERCDEISDAPPSDSNQRVLAEERPIKIPGSEG